MKKNSGIWSGISEIDYRGIILKEGVFKLLF